MSKHHVCHLAKFYPPATGGIETHVRTLAQAQADMGANVTVVCINHADRSGRDVTWDALTPTPSCEEHEGIVRIRRVGRFACLARLDLCPELPRLLAQLARDGVDLFHLHSPNPTMLLALALVRPPVPLVITHHSDVVRQKVLGTLFRPFESWVYAGASRIIANAPSYPQGSALLRTHAAKVNVVPMGLDLTPFLQPSAETRAFTKRLRAEHGSPLWLAVGRLVYYKGLRNAIVALADVPGHLLIVGQGPLQGELQQLAIQSGVASRITWQGRASVDELIGAYHAATALWFPSVARSEGFGLVQVEAMACGCPVINTAIPDSGVAWVSRHDETGLTVPVNDPPALAAAANRLARDPELHQRLAAGARRRAQEEFNHRLMAERTLAIYRQVLEGKAVTSAPTAGAVADHSGHQ